MADTTVKFLHSAMAGAPTLSGTVGSMIAVLDACLINGFGSGTVDSVVVSGGVATVTRSTGHPMEVGTVALMAGATPAGLNGEKKVLSVTPTTYTFDATGVSNQTATGAITHKVAPLGWAKPFTGTNLAAYKPTDVTATGCVLRVDDTNARFARVVGYESMTGSIDGGVGPFPNATQQAGGGYWEKSNATDATSRAWIICGDGKLFYFPRYWTTTYNTFGLSAVFGDVNPARSGDAYHCLLLSKALDYSTSTPGNDADDFDMIAPTATSSKAFFARSFSGLGSPVQVRKSAALFGGNSASPLRSGKGETYFPNFPNPADGGMYLSDMLLGEVETNAYRGRAAGFYFSPQAIGASQFSTRDSVTGVAGLPGRVVKAVNSYSGVYFFDVTGPWR